MESVERVPPVRAALPRPHAMGARVGVLASWAARIGMRWSIIGNGCAPWVYWGKGLTGRASL